MKRTERRSCQRVAFHGIVFLNVNGQQVSGIAANLSETGLLFHPLKHTRPAGDRFWIKFVLPKINNWVKLEGRLVHQSRANKRLAWGIQFTDVPRSIRRQLRSFVSSQARSRPTTPLPRPRVAFPPPVPLAAPRRRPRPGLFIPLEPVKTDLDLTPLPAVDASPGGLEEQDTLVREQETLILAEHERPVPSPAVEDTEVDSDALLDDSDALPDALCIVAELPPEPAAPLQAGVTVPYLVSEVSGQCTRRITREVLEPLLDFIRGEPDPTREKALLAPVAPVATPAEG